jgi:hypothetical protein
MNDVYIVIAFNKENFYPVGVCDNLVLAKQYADREYKERAKSHRIHVYKKTMNAPQLMEDAIVYQR